MMITNPSFEKKKYDAIVNVVDALSLERHLYLTYQLLERDLPIIVVVNRMDLAKKHGYEINISELSNALGCQFWGCAHVTKKILLHLKIKLLHSSQVRSWDTRPQVLHFERTVYVIGSF